ncbi:hypothetical protein SCP_0901580 [Sparassis crispa]|uniref:Uncharacterized protein n=1 Tax=Sparassis crispa TaxID=139825 RepID=A0A401GVS3_9APHY|nr:hypothetical protein SCP_0901580 [Sparassis crispa]GBE86279.1 hypothetical protein SCP_0901580 [Sparassis crispa]
MGNAQSLLSPHAALAALVVAGAAYGYALYTKPLPPPPADADSATGVNKAKKKKKKAGAAPEDVAEASPTVVSFPTVIPGDFEPPSTAPETEPSSKPAKAKKKKGKKASTPVGGGRTVPVDTLSESSATAPESNVSAPVRPLGSKAKKTGARAPSIPVGAEEQWTRVETRRRNTPQQAPKIEEGAEAGTGVQLEVSTSDAGITTSTSSLVADRTEDEVPGRERRRTLAEKVQPKSRRTGVDDMLETPDHPTMATVVRIQPGPDEKPAAGFSWADYEDVDDSRGTADDADGEDDGGWGIVKGRGRSKTNKSPGTSQQLPPHTALETMTKKQRQNAARREAQKSAKVDAEEERQARLALHKRELERAKIAEQYSNSGKTTSGGMTAFVDENGKLVWK